MKAAILEKYDKNGRDLVVRDVPMPAVGPNDVLVRVRAAGVNPLDNMIVRGEVRLIVGYKTPLVMGNELVGTVEETGASVTGFAKGDRVFCRMPLDRIGAFAEYAAIDAGALAKVPDYLSDEEAACVPLTSLTAQQAYGLMNVKTGDSLFISGGTGSVGAMAIPVAKSLGLSVATSGNAASRERVEALGVDTFIDYRTQKIGDVLHDVDHVLDTLGDKALPEEFQILKTGGNLVSLKAVPNGAFARRMGLSPIKRLMFSLVGHKYDAMAAKKDQTYDFIFVHSDGAGLAKIADVFAERQVRPSVDGVFSLDDVNAAMAKVAAGGSKGKTVLRMG